MSEKEEILENQELDDEPADEEPKQEKKVKNEELDLNDGIVRRSDKTVKERFRDSKQRAIEAFKRGELDPEFRVVKMSNGKFRCYKRKEPLTPTPINVNQVQPNIPSQAMDNIESKPRMKQSKSHSPFDDIVYYNMTNQISEQLNKRLDAVNAEIERLRHKNGKLKNKYKQLKQAIYITEEEEKDEVPVQQPVQQHESEPTHEQQQSEQQQSEPQQHQPPIGSYRRAPVINFNRFFN